MQTEPLLLPRFANRRDFLTQAKADNVAFLEANKGRVVIQYVRDQDFNLFAGVKGSPNAVFIAYKDDRNAISFGWSAARVAAINPKTGLFRPSDKFDKTEGLWRAIRRATRQGRPARKMHPRLMRGEGLTFPEFVDRAVEELNREK